MMYKTPVKPGAKTPEQIVNGILSLLGKLTFTAVTIAIFMSIAIIFN